MFDICIRAAMHSLFTIKVLILVNAVLLQNAVYGQNGNECGECDSNSCESPRNCFAGFVKDSCDCCYLCGNKEGERCEHESLPYERLGRCGDNLECRLRNDLDWDDPPEAVCVCAQQRPLCGSDGITYDNICQLTEARYSRRDGLRAISTEPCIKPPTIISPPQNIRNSTGSYAVLTCEARAWPLPAIHWERNSNGMRVRLPGNNTRLAVQSRSGPNTDETTSWLLFLNISKDDGGTYLCKAENDVGSATESATVVVT